MAGRSIVYDQEQIDPFDVLWQEKDFVAAIGGLEVDLTGQTTTVVAGFAATPTAPTSLSVNLGAGRLYQQSPIDPTTFGALPSDTTVIQQQGYAAAQSVTLSTSGLASGQSMWALVQAQFSLVDIIRPNDPTGGVLNYINPDNPTQVFQGPNGDGQSQPTVRQATVSIAVIYGTPASTGSEVPPNPTNGWVPLYLVDLAFAQTTISSGQILIAGPSVGSNVPSNYPQAPFLAGLLNQHHKGTAGQAPQIDLTAEVKNVLPMANLPASNTVGGIASFRVGSGNPNGNLAGNYNVNGGLDAYWDNVNKLLYVCTVTGTSSTATWTSVSSANTSIFSGGTATGTVNAQVVASTSPTGFTKTAGQVVTFTGLNNTGSTTLNVDGTGVSTIQKNTGSGDVNLTGGELDGFVTVVWTGSIYLLQPGLLGQLSTMNIGQWLKNDGAGNLTLNVDPSLQDNGSGELQVTPSYLPQAGVMVPYAGSAAPNGWLLCNGQNVSRTTYAALFAVCGILYGSGDGVTTFGLPDPRGRTVAGVDGGANRLTTATMSSQALGGTGGAETIVLTSAQIPAHTHPNTLSDPGHSHANTLTDPGHGHPGSTITVQGNSSGSPLSTAVGFGYNNGGQLQENFLTIANNTTGVSINNASATTGLSITNASNAGGGGSHHNVQPTLELNYLIKY